MGTRLSVVLHQPVPGILWHWCPGCQERHPIHVRSEQNTHPTSAVWDWDGEVEHPTFSPSIRVFDRDGRRTQCHYFIQQGKIQFCGDSQHHLAGQTVPLPNLPG